MIFGHLLFMSVLYACVFYFCICTCSVQLSMFHMEKRSRNTLIIIIIIVVIMACLFARGNKNKPTKNNIILTHLSTKNSFS